MLDKHDHLFLRDEALEVVPRLFGGVGLELGRGPVPKDAHSEREEVLHEMSLARKLHINITLAQTGRTPV